MSSAGLPFVSHRMQRLQNERGVVMTLFWVQTAEGFHRLAASVRKRTKHPPRLDH